MRLHFQAIGQGRALVLLHGLFGSGDNWGGVARGFAERFRVVTPDLRNHGRSPHAEAMDYPAMAQDVAELLRAEGLAPAHILGHSMGGKVAMTCALQAPALVRSLGVVDIAPGPQPDRHTQILDALRALPVRELQTRGEMEAALAAAIPDLAVRRFLLKSVVRDARGHYFWRLNLEALQRNYARLNDPVRAAEAFPGPTLFVRGGNSDYVGDRELAEISRLFPRFRLVTLPGVGHWVHAEAPAEFVRVVLDFHHELEDPAGE
jgi:pimeloyl-ACP methyl ester carboxylesterase